MLFDKNIIVVDLQEAYPEKEIPERLMSFFEYLRGLIDEKHYAGFKTKREANTCRDEVIGQLHSGTYIVYGKIKVEEFMSFWLEDVMRPRITDDSYLLY